VPSSDEARAQSPDVTAEDQQPSAGNRRKVLLISAAAVVALVVAGLVVFLVTRDDSPETADGGPAVPTIEGSAPPGGESAQAPPDYEDPPLTQPSTSSAQPPASGADAGEAQSVAEQAATAITDADMETLTQLSCDPGSVGDDDTFPPDAQVEVVGEPQIVGDTATIDIRVTIPGADPATVPMPLTKQDGRWCIP
jgi:hypothetical protein